MKLSDEEFIDIPVVFNFDNEDIIGGLRIHKSAIPVKPDAVIALGYKADANGQPMDNNLVVATLVPEIKYMKYLEEKYGTN